jgi:2-keto-3-deoxy-L-rhamnonate aldolase RhmA
MSRLFKKLGTDEMAVGVWLKSGPSWVSTIARGGFDFVRPDMMFSAMDWRDLDHINQAAKAVGLTTWLRVAANPWLAGAGQLQITVDVARAFSLGVQIVGASVSSAAQVRACIEVSKDWHRSGAGEYPNSNDTFVSMNNKVSDAAVFVPHIEAGGAIEEIDEILDIEGLRIIMIAMTDFSQALGYPFQYDHPEVWKAVDKIVKKCRERGIVVAANSGYDFTTPEQIVQRIARMYEHGIRICLMQGADTLFENSAKSLLSTVHKTLA